MEHQTPKKKKQEWDTDVRPQLLSLCVRGVKTWVLAQGLGIFYQHQQEQKSKSCLCIRGNVSGQDINGAQSNV